MMPQRRPRILAASLLLSAVLASTGCGASSAAMAPAAPPTMGAGPAPELAATPTGEAMAPSSGSGGVAIDRLAVLGAPASQAPSSPSSPSPARPPSPAPPPQNGAPAAVGARSAAVDADVDAPLIVYAGEITAQVDAGAGPAAVDAIVAVAESLGGHLAGRDEGRVIVKVPSRRFREAMSRIEGSFEVVRRNVKADDVTAEFKDLEVRLENLRATRKRIEELLQKSGTLADTLTVERELERVAAEIDRIQGRLRFLRAHTSMSTLTATVVEKPKAPQVVAVKAPPPPPPPPKRELALSLGWLDRVGVETLVAVPPAD